MAFPANFSYVPFAAVMLAMGIAGGSWRALAMSVGIARRYDACVHACFVYHRPAAAEMAPFLRSD